MKKLLHSEILKERLTTEESLSIERHPISLMIVNVRSLYNVGSIFRTADSVRISELILCGYTPYPPRKEIDKTALGSTESVPWSYFKSAIDAIKDIKSKGIKVIAVEITDKKRNYDTLNKSDFPLCLVLGNELTGLDDKTLSECDDAIEIPMYGVKHSLNVSVAAGIVAYEAVRIYKHNTLF